MNDTCLSLRDIERSYKQADNKLEVLRHVNLKLKKGELVALIGPSGAGKSTLLHIAGLLEFPNAGEVIINETECSYLSDDARSVLRQTEIGFVYQSHHLLPEFSALENVMIPKMIAGSNSNEAKKKAFSLIEAVGLSGRASHRPAALSGGEQQRVAISRALANGPSVLLADEPTGNLDSHTASKVFLLLRELVRGYGLAALVATHNTDLADGMDRIVRLEDGLLIDQSV